MPTSPPGTSSSTPSPADRPARAETALLLAAAAALVVAVGLRQADAAEGFSLGAAAAGIAAELPVTLPAALLVAIAALADLAAGAVLLRLARRTPYATWSDLVLAGYAGAVLLDTLLLFSLGLAGLFWQGTLAAVVAIVIAGGRLARPLVAVPFRVRRPNLARWLLLGLAWCGPLLLSLASPVVPAADILPNHVAPAEHLRMFGVIASLATYPSPIYGTSRLFLGYSALMGTLSTLTGLPAALAVAAAAGPIIALSAVSVRRLASAAFGREAGFWALLAFPLSFTFVRLADVRDSVAALPLAALALALMVAPGKDRVVRSLGGRPDWLLAAALTAATLVHPLVGALAVASVALLAIADPARNARRAIPALGATATAASPQLAVMVGLAPAPPWGIVAFGAAVGAAVVLARIVDRVAWSRISSRWATIGVVAGMCVCLTLIGLLVPGAPGQAGQWLNPAFPLLFGAAGLATLGLVPTVRAGRRLLLAPLAVGAVFLLVLALIPGSSVLTESLRYEVPKAVGYWLPWACVPAAGGVLAAAARWRGPPAARGLALAGFLAIVLLPFGAPTPDAVQASHPVADVLAYDLSTAESGYWQAYPDSRLIVDASGDQVIEFLRREINAGRLTAESQLLHVAASYQQAANLPIADLSGIEETIVCPDAPTNIFTAGGRIYPIARLAAELRDGFAYVVLQPADLPGAVRAGIIAAGYRSVFANLSAEVFVAPS